MIYYIYKYLSILLYPIIYLCILDRKRNGREDGERISERFGISNWSRPSRGRLIWINAASVGESLSIVPVIDKINQTYPDINILVTTTTVTAANILKNKLPSTVIHQYMPIDVSFVVERFVNYWRPNLAIFTESELWPNLINATSKICPMILLNAKMSDRSFKKWSWARSLAKQILEKFSIILPQGYVDKERLSKLGAKNLYYIGNLKYASPPLSIDQNLYEELKEMIGQRRVLVASSTHKNEEETLAKIHVGLRKLFPDLLTIIAPRHTTRSLEIGSKLEQIGANYSVRSDKGVINEKTDIYLADTMGELGVFYKMADIVFIGGSLIPQGGHNPIEAAYLDCVILMGPFTFNFKEIVHEFSSKNAICLSKDEYELEQNIKYFFENPDILKEYAAASKKLVTEAHNILDLTVEKIISYLEK
jgi:3-deoxy-D-manno-octulosonic-acid transferase